MFPTRAAGSGSYPPDTQPPQKGRIVFNITLERPLATLAVTAGLLAAAAGPASASAAGPLIAPAHGEVANGPTSFELVLDGVDIGLVSPTPPALTGTTTDGTTGVPMLALDARGIGARS
jgi:hypothetical protein